MRVVLSIDRVLEAQLQDSVASPDPKRVGVISYAPQRNIEGKLAEDYVRSMREGIKCVNTLF